MFLIDQNEPNIAKMQFNFVIVIWGKRIKLKD